MANEGVIKVQYPVAGLTTITAKILKPDDTVRDGQTAVALRDDQEINQDNLYSNPGAITIEPGDSILAYLSGVNFTAGEYQPEVTVINPDDCKMTASELEAAMKAITGITVGGTWTWEKIMKITTAFVGGDWRLSADGTKQELMDAENGTTVILEQTLTRSPVAGSKYRNYTVKI